MSIIYFDICAIPLFLIILFVCYSRKMTKGNANRLFIGLVILSLIAAITDLGIELPARVVPLSEAVRVLCCVSTYIYLIVRNATNAVLLLFLLHLTQTSFLIRKKWVKVVFCLPYAAIVALLIQNVFTHNVFTITAEGGYSRGPMMIALYGTAFVYGIAGLSYCIYCRRYLPLNKWIALIGIYVLAYCAVVVQLLWPHILVELFFTAIGEMLIMLSIMRPEERMDSDVGVLSWASYQTDLQNILKSGEHVLITVIQIPNAREIRNYLGDHKYNEYLAEIANGIRTVRRNQRLRFDIYFERPGTFYLTIDPDEAYSMKVADRLPVEIGNQIRQYTEKGIRFEPNICLIRCPEDLKNAGDILILGHKFQKFTDSDQTMILASDIVHSKTFDIEAHIEEILDRAIKEDHIEMYYQPIYDVRSGKFVSAEALARIIDPEYGLISPNVFIPSAETQGLIIPFGDMVLDKVFRFVSEHDLKAMGLSYIELNLSVAQCMESNLLEKICAIREKYDVDPAQINLEITETTFENETDIMLKNICELAEKGYTFSLDDYGTGYSNIQRVNHIPLKVVKLDKSMLDEIPTEQGRTILKHTIHMMQDIGKEIVAEGVESPRTLKSLSRMGCDMIQGFYFSKPVPVSEFIRFIEDHNSESCKPDYYLKEEPIC